jgi:hypothetical protein
LSYQEGGQWQAAKAGFKWFMTLAEEAGMSVMITFQHRNLSQLYKAGGNRRQVPLPGQ